MNLSEMITLVRRDLKDEDLNNYQWSDDELTRHVSRAVKELSEPVPLPAKATLPTTAGSRQVDISSLTDRVMVQAVEYPVDKSPARYQRFSVWGDTLTVISGDEPNGANCYIYYGVLHTLDADGSTIPAEYEDLVATGAGGCAAIEWAAFAINRVNIGGTMTSREYRIWGNERLRSFRDRLKRLGRKQRIRTHQLFID
ncbi:MAG: hypothetical protein D4S01_05620 [Dehalococcoidia bacterium]|nr:MAG: hypothetical protein D4S01_05620 [Dehalococcoidia bacterium]